MSEKRKDKSGRILRTGESQRKDLIYQYRYTDILGKRQTIYASTLQELREKEKAVQKETDDGMDYASGNLTVVQLLERYISLKQGVRYNTKVGYQFVLNIVKKETFGCRKIREIKTSDAKLWIMKLYNDGRGYSTITSVRGVVRPAFEMAYNEDIIRKNPFDFKLDIIPNTSKKRIAMTKEQQEAFMNFIAEDNHYKKYWDEFTLLLETGLRISELVGLTKGELDFKARKIKVDHQLSRTRGGTYYIEKTKTECGVRYLPMSDIAYSCLKRILENRKKPTVEMMVDGYSGFLLLDKDGRPKVALHIEHVMKRAWNKYNDTHAVLLPLITPHVFRHTFCTNMADAGMDIKSLQYLMGHSDVGITLNVYTHSTYAKAEEAMAKIVKITPKAEPEKQRISV